MASSDNGPDEIVGCPYNIAHQMLRKNLQKHLLKCRLSHPDSMLEKCPFNPMHLISETEMKTHCASCPDKRIIAGFKYSILNNHIKKEKSVKSEPIPKGPKIEDEVDWDAEGEYETYNPLEYASRAPIIRSNTGSIPSQRREFRITESKRLQTFYKKK